MSITHTISQSIQIQIKIRVNEFEKVYNFLSYVRFNNNKKTLTYSTQELKETNIKYISLFRQIQEALNKDGSGSRLGVALRYNYIKDRVPSPLWCACTTGDGDFSTKIVNVFVKKARSIPENWTNVIKIFLVWKGWIFHLGMLS